MKRNIKKFFTFARRSNGGFTLVELIVVIAILAILAGVAVPAYSGYVTRTNMTADQTLVNEVAHALKLHYYSNTSDVQGGYVVVTTDKAMGDENGFGAAAMEKVFGSTWQDTALLKHDGWKTVVNGENMQIISGGNTSFNKDNLPSLLDRVNGLTNAAEGIDLQNKTQLVEYANKMGLTDATNEELANMLPMYVADNLNSVLNDDEKKNEFDLIYQNTSGDIAADLMDLGMDRVTAYAVEYAQVEGLLQHYVNNGNDESKAAASELLNQWKTASGTLQNITDVQGLLKSTKEQLAEMQGTVLDVNASEQYYTEKVGNDSKAFLGYMEGLSSVSSSLVADRDALKNSDFYSNGSIGNMVVTYLNAGDLMRDLGLSSGAGIVMIDANGNVEIYLSE